MAGSILTNTSPLSSPQGEALDVQRPNLDRTRIYFSDNSSGVGSGPDSHRLRIRI